VNNSGCSLLREARTKAQERYLAGVVYSNCRVDLTARSAQLKRAGWAVSTVPAGWDVPAAAGSGGWLVWSQVLSPAG